MLLIILTFLLTSAGYGVLLWLAIRRISRHLKGNEAGVKAVVDHILIPLLGRRPEDESESPTDKPEMP